MFFQIDLKNISDMTLELPFFTKMNKNKEKIYFSFEIIINIFPNKDYKI